MPTGNDDENDDDDDEVLACDSDLLAMMSPEQSAEFDSMTLTDQVAAIAVQRARFGKQTAGIGARPSPKAMAKAKAGLRPQTPPRTDARKMKCVNCGGEHATRDCSKPLVAFDQRRCFNCDEVGHNAKDCKHPKKVMMAAPEGSTQIAPRVLCMMTEDAPARGEPLANQGFRLGGSQVVPGRGK